MKLIRCLVEIKTQEGRTVSYHGLYQSTTDAVIDALERFGFGKVSKGYGMKLIENLPWLAALAVFVALMSLVFNEINMAFEHLVYVFSSVGK